MMLPKLDWTGGNEQTSILHDTTKLCQGTKLRMKLYDSYGLVSTENLGVRPWIWESPKLSNIKQKQEPAGCPTESPNQSINQSVYLSIYLSIYL